MIDISMNNRFAFITGLLMLVVSWALVGCNPREDEQTALLSQEQLIERGRYLTQILDCATCHTPKTITPHGPVPDTSLLMSGHPAGLRLNPYNRDLIFKDGWALMNPNVTAFVGPWGESYAGNITPDDTGIGSWTSKQFKVAIKEGKYKGLESSRPLMPPMPVEAFSHLTDEDVEAIFVYLKTLKPVENIVPAFKPHPTN